MSRLYSGVCLLPPDREAVPQPVHHTERWPTTNMKVLFSILIFKVLIVIFLSRLQSFLPHGVPPQIKAGKTVVLASEGVCRLLPLCLKRVWEKQAHPSLIHLVTNNMQYFARISTAGDFSSFICRH